VGLDITPQIIIGLQIATGFNLPAPIGVEGGLVGDRPHDPDSTDQGLHVTILLAEIVLNQGLVMGIGAVQAHTPPRMGTQIGGMHGPAMGEETVRCLGGRNGCTKKELQVWTAHIRLRANKPTGLGRIGGETAAALEDPAEHISDIPVQNPW